MRTQDQPLTLTLPTEVLELGCLLHKTASAANAPTRMPGNPMEPEKMDAIVSGLLAKVRKDAEARKALCLRHGGKDTADRIRLKAVAFLSWQSLRLSDDICDLGDLAAAVVDPKLPPSEALLRSRHEIGLMLVEDTLIGTADWGDRLFSKVHLPSRTLEWMAGGEHSRGGLTPRMLANLLIPREDAPAEEPSSSQTDTIPSVSKLHELICRDVIGLDDQARALASRLVMHLARANLLRKGLEGGTGNQAILLVGNSGCGKTHLMESAASAAGCPFASMSATAMTSEGYVGGKLDDLFKSLVTRAKGNLKAARFGIAFADEWDKKAIRDGRDITTLSVQQEVLVPMQGAEFQIAGKRGMDRPCTFNSRGTFFAFAGAFAGLPEIMKKRRMESVIGFSKAAATKSQDYVLDALRDYGYVKEFVNRLTSVMWLPDPAMVSLEKAAANGILDRYNILLGELGIVLYPQPGAIQRMAEYAFESRTFYRGVSAVWGNIAEMMLASGATGTGLIDIAEVKVAIDRISSGGVSGAVRRPNLSPEDTTDTGLELSYGTRG
jgi:ATP-dependent Clp protease ATP-binding subunit ClpX